MAVWSYKNEPFGIVFREYFLPKPLHMKNSNNSGGICYEKQAMRILIASITLACFSMAASSIYPRPFIKTHES